MGPSISTVQTYTTEAMQGGAKAALDDVIGTYQGRKISTGGKNPSEAGLELNSATRFFHEAEKPPGQVKSQSRQAADARAQRMRSALSKMFPELRNSAALMRFTALTRRMQRERRYDDLGEEMESLFPDPSVRFAVAKAMSSDLSGEGGGSQDELCEHLEQYSARLEEEHGPAIAAGNNISEVVNETVAERPDNAGDVRNFYRQTVCNYKAPADAYQFIATNLSNFSGEHSVAGGVPAVDSPDFDKRLEVALDFLTRGLAADLAAAKPSGEPAQLREVVDGLQQVRFLGNAHVTCRQLLLKFHNSTDSRVPVEPYRLMSGMLGAVKSDRISDSDFTNLTMSFHLPPLEPSINFMTQFRDIVRNLPARVYEKPESRERVLDAMQKAIDQFIDEEEASLE